MDRISRSRESRSHLTLSSPTRNSRPRSDDGRRPGTQLRPSPVMLDTEDTRSRPLLYPSPFIDRDSSQNGKKERSIAEIRNSTRKKVGNLPMQLQRSRASAASASSLLRSTHDQGMASQQSRIDSLPPAERQKQEAWAQYQLQQIQGTCVAGFAWGRIQGGYRCHGGHHMVTDELLAEGRGGCYWTTAVAWATNPIWEGPFYGRREAMEHMWGLGGRRAGRNGR